MSPDWVYFRQASCHEPCRLAHDAILRRIYAPPTHTLKVSAHKHTHTRGETQTVVATQITQITQIIRIITISPSPHRAHAASAMRYLNAGGGLLFVFGGQLGRGHPFRHLIGDMHIALNTEIQRLRNQINTPTRRNQQLPIDRSCRALITSTTIIADVEEAERRLRGEFTWRVWPE